MGEILWQPGSRQIQQSNMFRFMRAVNEEFSLSLETWSQFHRWSVEHLSDFWEFYNRVSGIRYHRFAEEVLSSRTMPGARWFSGAKLNYAENLLGGPSDKPAIISKTEIQPLKVLTYGQLSRAVTKFAAALQKAGLRPGDRVAGYLPNIPETVIAMLGASAIGAVWSSCSPDFGETGVRDRFGQIEPRILICADGYTYNGKPYTLLNTINTLAREVESLEHIIIVPFLDRTFPKAKVTFRSVHTWEEFLDREPSGELEFFSADFNHPLCILYSSGTTGLPKCIVHGTGGTLLQHHKEHSLHTGIGPEDVVFYFTTCGWMMWNWLVSVLAQKATLVLYEGSPGYPSLNVLWELIDEAGITVFGTSPKFLAQNQKQKLIPGKLDSLQSLRVILSTGAPLDEESFRWVYQQVKGDLQLSSISGGTDIISCFMLGNPMLPVRAGEIQCIGLGMDVAALDENGRAVLNRKGELVCRSPAPSMPIYFWRDPGDRKYKQAYFSKIPGVWRHGDFIEIRDHGGVIVYGRSDATLNPGGVRIGTGEIYRIVENLDEILDSLVIGIEENRDIRMILFLVLPESMSLNDSLLKKIRDAIRKQATPRHVPQEIYQVREIPRTLNGKKVELTVRNIFQGEAVQNKSALARPECLEEYRAIYSNRLAIKNN